jgi:ComF family protein
LSDLIIQFKQKRDFVAGKALSELFAKAIRHHYRQQHLPLPDLIAPVPQHWKSQWQRSFNHAIIFSHEISQQLSIPIFKALKRVRATPPQKALDKKARLANLQQSFHITDSLNGEHIAIVDDVMTTGATANTLAQALKAAGAGKVTIWVLARTPKPNNKTR